MEPKVLGPLSVAQFTGLIMIARWLSTPSCAGTRHAKDKGQTLSKTVPGPEQPGSFIAGQVRAIKPARISLISAWRNNK